MSDTKIPLETQEEHEHNPKAVFYGGAKEIITPLALYLSERSVDLYDGKTLSDAFFGDYFFYVGPFPDVKQFIASSQNPLPKTLLILTDVSDQEEVRSALAGFLPVKWVLTNKSEFDSEEAREVIEFFFGSSARELTIKQPVTTAYPLAAVPVTESTPQAIVETVVQPSPPSEATSDNREAGKIPATEGNDDETKKRIQDLYGVAPNPTREKTKTAPVFKVPLKSAVVILVVLVFLPFLLIVLGAGGGGVLFYTAYSRLKAGDIETAGRLLPVARAGFSLARRNAAFLHPLFSIAHLGQVTQTTEQLLEVGEASAHGTTYLAEAAGDSLELYAGITGAAKGANYGHLISAVKGNLTLADTKFALVEAELQAQPLGSWIGSTTIPVISDNLSFLRSRIIELRESVVSAKAAIALAPELIGLSGKRTYLVAFQNNMELRPTGGFMGSYGLISFEDGTLKDFAVEDVYTADGALEGHVDPPDPIRVHLAQEHWYLRDSNWDPDFAKSAARMAWFLEKEIDTKVDGVIAVDLTMARYVLEVIGPVTLSDVEQKEITADNLFLEAHASIESEFFPGSTHKKDLLGSLAREMQQRLFAKPEQLPQLVGQVKRSLSEKHAQVFFVSQTAQKLASEAGWTGELKEAACEGCVKDMVMVVDANLGVNKANYFIDREIEDTISLTEGAAAHELTIAYTNSASSADVEVGGEYKNYLRVLAPTGTFLKEVTVDGIAQTLDEGPVASSSSAVATPQGEFVALATLVTVPAGSSKKVVFRYDVPLLLSPESHYSYTHLKQSGTDDDLLTVSAVYPAGWSLGLVNGVLADVAGASTLVTGSQITYNNSLLTDRVLEIQFGP